VGAITPISSSKAAREVETACLLVAGAKAAADATREKAIAVFMVNFARTKEL
jgi:hypothetical protein